jgi:hypothetical protein
MKRTMRVNLELFHQINSCIYQFRLFITVHIDCQEPAKDDTIECQTAVEDGLATRTPNDDLAEIKSDYIELDTANLDTSTRTEKGSEEGFCCVMSLFDGVVL